MNYFEKEARNKLIQALFLMEIGSIVLIAAMEVGVKRGSEALTRTFTNSYEWPAGMKASP